MRSRTLFEWKLRIKVILDSHRKFWCNLYFNVYLWGYGHFSNKS
jgi:hypothetical protein